MIKWDEIDSNLGAIGKDRAWLAEQTPYSPDSIRNALGPNSSRRSDKMLSVLSRAIEDEKARQLEPREIAPDIFAIFRDKEQLHRADRASRIVGAPSLVDFCREVIAAAADRALRGENVVPENYTSPEAPSLRVAETAPDPPPDEEDPPLGGKRKRA